MDTRKLTESAVFSALLVMIGILFISTFIGYQIYLDFLLPILITLIYLRCDFKYTLLSSITSVILISFVFGNPAYSLWMIQNITIGFVCGFLIKRETVLMDDLFYCSLFATVILVFVDIFLSGIIGYSFMAEAQDALVYIEGDYALKEVVFYMLLAALPLGTVIMTYIGGLVIGKRLRLLNESALRKFVYVRKFKKYGGLQYCSPKTIAMSIIYLLVIKVIGRDNLLFNITYFKTVFITMEYIILYFLLKDSYSIACSYIYKRTAKRIIVMFFQLTVLFSLFTYFKITACILVIGALVIDVKYKVRNTTDKLLKSINIKGELC